MRTLLTILRACGAVLAAAGTLSCGGAGPEPTPAELPELACPADQTIVAPTGSGVTFPSPVVTGGAPPVGAPTCIPSSGGAFPLGATRVTCTVLDARQQRDTCTFFVTVQEPPRLTVTRFAAFGDSITAGADGASLRPLPLAVNPLIAYPTVLQRLLSERYVGQTVTVANLGNPGERLAEPETRLRFVRELSTRPLDAVFIMEGTNDIGSRDARDGLVAAEIMRQMIRDARGRGVRPFVATIPSMNPSGWRALAWSLVGPYNDRLRQVAAEEGVTLVDVHLAFLGQEASLLSFDGLHPSEAGYARIAEVFLSVIRDTLEAPAGGS